jgi:hypothetical protein
MFSAFISEKTQCIGKTWRIASTSELWAVYFRELKEMKRNYVICIKLAKYMNMWQPCEHGNETSVPKM